MINVGDVFLTKLERGFYGAFRILNKGVIPFLEGESFLIAVTSYIGLDKPNITNKELTKTLIENRFRFRGLPCIGIYTDKGIEKNFEYLGNLPQTEEERNMELIIGSGIGGAYPLIGVFKDKGMSAYYEWRWENEREAYINEIELREIESRNKRTNIIMKPKDMLEEKVFWDIIRMFNWESEDVIKDAFIYLKKEKVSFIKKFEETLTYKLYCLDTKELAIDSGLYNVETEEISVDNFLYYRCYIVAKGEEYYNNILNKIESAPKEGDFEILLGLASDAYESKRKREFEYYTGCSYETFSNIDGWK